MKRERLYRDQGGVIPADYHYDVLKYIESRINEQLGSLEPDWLMTGLRVGYTTIDDNEEEPSQSTEITMEYGYLGHLDGAKQVEISSLEEWEKITDKHKHKNPLPIGFIDSLYADASEELERIANRQLRINISGVLFSGVRYTCFGTSCSCWAATRPFVRKGYWYEAFGTCKYFCTAQSCRSGLFD